MYSGAYLVSTSAGMNIQHYKQSVEPYYAKRSLVGYEHR